MPNKTDGTFNVFNIAISLWFLGQPIGDALIETADIGSDADIRLGRRSAQVNANVLAAPNNSVCLLREIPI
jgi:hypothetical protein